MKQVTNFGKNICFEPAAFFEPESEEEFLTIPKENASKKIRVIGSLHSRNEGIVSNEIVISLTHFRQPGK